MADEDKDPLSSANLFKDIGAALAKEQEDQEAFDSDPNAYRFPPGEGVAWDHDGDSIFGDTLPEGDGSPEIEAATQPDAAAPTADASKMTPAEYEKHLASKGLNKPLV
jgi:hypothetical protein